MMTEGLRRAFFAAQDAIPPYPVVCRRAGNSTRRGLRRHRAGRGEEDVLERMVRGQQQAHPPRVAQHRRADLEQLDADGGRARPGQLGAVQSIGCTTRSGSRGSATTAAAARVSPMRSSSWRNSIMPPSLDRSPPLKSASIRRRPRRPNSILSPVHFGMAKPSPDVRKHLEPQGLGRFRLLCW